MKSRYIGTNSKRNKEMIAEEIDSIVTSALNADRYVYIIAVARHFGLGRKRLMEFINTLNKLYSEFHQHDVDGVFDLKVEEELGASRITLNDIKPPETPFKLKLLAERKSGQPNVSYQEAKSMQDFVKSLGKLPGIGDKLKGE